MHSSSEPSSKRLSEEELFAACCAQPAPPLVAGDEGRLDRRDHLVEGDHLLRLGSEAARLDGTRIVHVGTDGLHLWDPKGDNVEFHGTYVVNRFCCASIDGSRIVAAGRDELVGLDASGRNSPQRGYLMK